MANIVGCIQFKIIAALLPDINHGPDAVGQQKVIITPVGRRASHPQFLDDLVDFRGAEVKSVAVDAERGVTMVEWFYDYTHRAWGERRYQQVSVQRWEDGQIVYEQFYYGS